MPHKKPALAVACLIFNQGRLLLSRRAKTPQQNSWQCPGGFVHFNETLIAAGERILQQKVGIVLPLKNTALHSNNIFKNEQVHSCTLYLSAGCSVSLINHDEWQWYRLDHLPQPLFLPLQILFSQYPEELSQLSRTHTY